MEEVRILIADDDKEILYLLKTYLEREWYNVDVVMDGQTAIRRFESEKYNVVILDLMLPIIDGIEVCRRLRNKTNVPILMLTAKDHETDKILGLSMGADDYITKPFSINEVVARVKSLIRRYFILGGDERSLEPERTQFKDLILDRKTCSVFVRGNEIALTAKELELLTFFVSHPGQVFTKRQLFQQVWNRDYIEDDNTVMVHIRKLRKKIERDPSDPQFIQTVWGIGYKFVGEKNEG